MSIENDPEIRIVQYDPDWAGRFARLGQQLRAALGNIAVRIDHIGSTSVVGLAAKPVIDVQISVSALEPIDPFLIPLQQCGFVHRADNTERTKRYFREAPGAPRTHVHVRRAGGFSEQFALLFRDYLRVHERARVEYAKLKRDLAARFPDDRHAYTEAKVPFFWETIRRADEWAQRTGWEPGPTDPDRVALRLRIAAGASRQPTVDPPQDPTDHRPVMPAAADHGGSNPRQHPTEANPDAVSMRVRAQHRPATYPAGAVEAERNLGMGTQVDDLLSGELLVAAPAALPFLDHLLRRRHVPSVPASGTGCNCPRWLV